MIKTTTDSIDGYEIIQYLDVVSYTEDAFEGYPAYPANVDDAIDNLDHPDADAIIGIKVVCLSSAIVQHCDDDGDYYLENKSPSLIAYGTAVKIRKK